MTDDSKMSVCDKKQYAVWFTIMVMETLKQHISHKWPNFTRGLISAEIERYVKEGLEREMGTHTHTHKSTVLREAENKPNWHTSKKPIKVPGSQGEPESIPNPNPNAIVLTSNGKSSGGQQRQSQSDSSIYEWAIGSGIEITDKDKEWARRTHTDLAFCKEEFTIYMRRLIARRNQSINNNVDSKFSERKKENIKKMREIILFLDNKDLLDKGGRATKDNFRNAVSVIYDTNRQETIRAIIRNLISDGEIIETRIGNVIYGKHSGKRSDMTHYQIIDKDMLLK
jgi:hypothetical protein